MQYKEPLFKILLTSSTSSESIKAIEDRIHTAFKDSGKKASIDSFETCDEAFYRIKTQTNDYDFFVINTENPKCYGHSLIDYIGSFPQNKNKTKLLISGSIVNIHSKNYIGSKQFYYVPEEKLIQIHATEFNNTEILKKIIKTFFTETPTLYISYGNDPKFTSREIIEEFDKLARIAIPHFNILFDFKSLKIGSDVKQFMNNMKDGDIVLLIINEKYFNSPYCMEELVNMFEALHGRIYPLFLDSGRSFYDSRVYSTILMEWIQDKKHLETQQEQIISLGSRRDQSIDTDIHLRDKIIETLPRFREYVLHFFTAPIDLYRQEKYLDIFQKITNDLKYRDYIDFYGSEEEMKKALQNCSIKNPSS